MTVHPIIWNVDCGLGETLSKFGIGALAHLPVSSFIAGCLWWFQISEFVPVDLDLLVSFCGSECLKLFP